MSEELSTLTLVELLDLLEAPQTPPAPSMWPATTGWIWLGLAITLLVLIGIWRLHRTWSVNAYRRQALLEIEKADDDPKAIAIVLRRVAVAAFGRRDVASLTGDKWLHFLNNAGRGTTFSAQHGNALTRGCYSGSDSEPGLAVAAARWVRRHQTGHR